MILFRPEHVAPILEGRKTQTRRQWQRGRTHVGAVHAIRTARSGPDLATIRITGMRREALGAITLEGAQREGYASVEAYLRAFRRIYGHCKLDAEVVVVDFELVKEPA